MKTLEQINVELRNNYPVMSDHAFESLTIDAAQNAKDCMYDQGFRPTTLDELDCPVYEQKYINFYESSLYEFLELTTTEAEEEFYHNYEQVCAYGSFVKGQF